MRSKNSNYALGWLSDFWFPYFGAIQLLLPLRLILSVSKSHERCYMCSKMKETLTHCVSKHERETYDTWRNNLTNRSDGRLVNHSVCS